MLTPRTSPRGALAALSLTMLMPSLDTSIANASLPLLAEAFDASFHDVRWIVLAYLISITALIVVAGRLGDLLGRRRLMLAGIGLFIVASLLCGVAPTLLMLVAGRAAQGLGAAAMMALSVAFVREAVPESQTGRAMGLLGTMSAAGTALGPAAGGLLGATFGWEAIFLVNVPIGVLALLLAHRYLPADSPQATGARAWFEFPVRMVREPAFSASLTASTLVASVMMTTLVVGPFYLASTLGIRGAAAGLVLSVGPLAAALTGVPAGWIVDRAGALRMTMAGLAGIGLGAALLALMPVSFGVAGYLAPIVVMTASYATFQAANNARVMAGTHAGNRGVVSGLLSLSRNLGLIAGASVMGGLFAASGMRATFAVAATLMAAAIVFILVTTTRHARLERSTHVHDTSLHDACRTRVLHGRAGGRLGADDRAGEARV